MSVYLLNSPDSRVNLRIALDNGVLTYSVHRDQETVIESSPVGAIMENADLTCALTTVSECYDEINESYTIPAFKKSHCVNHCNTLMIGLKKDEHVMTLEARAYDDGVALRLILPEKGIMKKETTAFAIPESIRSVYGMKFRFSYEDEYRRIPSEDLYQNLLVFPMLLEAGHGVWGLLAEAAVSGEYGGSILSSTPESPTIMRITAPPDGFIPQTTPAAMPWRVVMVGSLDTIVNSNLLENLNLPCGIEDTSFIKPGMVAWSWMIENKSPGDFNRQKDYIDLAAKMNWPYSLDDGGWKRNNVDIPALVQYGKEKGVGLWIWEHRRFLSDRKIAEETIAKWASWGVAGLKIDFFESDTRERVALYDMLAEICAKHRLMVNFHGCSKPTGGIRQWPNVMSWEGVMGGENFQNFSTDYFVAPTAAHNCMLPFTRNVMGPMDYTPTTYGTYRTGTTDAHQTALPVIFTSYVCHIAEKPEVLSEHPCSEFLKGLPAAWDESHLLEGAPGCYVTMARRKDDNWYVAGICAGRPRTSRVDLSFLGDGEYKATLYQDDLSDLHAIDVAIGTMPPTEKEQYDEWEKITSRPTNHHHDLHSANISAFLVTRETKLEIPCVYDGGFALKIEKME